MKRNGKWTTLLISIFVSLVFFWSANILAKEVEDFYFWHQVTSNPSILTAQADEILISKKLKEARRERRIKNNLKNLKLDAKAAISVEFDSDGNEKILFERNINERLPIASVTKLMTSLVVFDLKETYNLNQIIKISKEAVSQEGDSRWGGLKVGENLSVKNLLYMALIESNNDAAFALTEPVGEKAFVDLMNLNARKIGLKNTRFFNPTGLEPDDLSDPINYSSAYDLARLAEYILNNYPKIFEITENESISILKPDGSLHHFIPENTNRLLEVVPGVIGGKTGWAPRASGCLVLVIKNPKKDGCFINVVLGSRDRFGDMKKIIEALGVKIKK